jgi:predicted amidohydrolase
MKVALVQIDSRADKPANIKKALDLTRSALSRGAGFVLLPEYLDFRGKISSPEELESISEPVDGPTSRLFRPLAARHKAYILLGSIHERGPLGKAYNTSILIGPRGEIRASYRKQNLFTVRLPQGNICEGKTFLPGRRLSVAAVGPFTLGMTVCFDLRFPVLYEKYYRRGANLFSVPASFSRTTGQAHWEALVRARAIETFSYVLAPDQVGLNGEGVRTWGHSLAVGPWGDVLAQAGGRKEETVFAHIDHRKIRSVRRMFPEHKIF